MMGMGITEAGSCDSYSLGDVMLHYSVRCKDGS
jgi:hypothetical protein